MSAGVLRQPQGQDVGLISWEPGFWDLLRPFLFVVSTNSGLLEFHVDPGTVQRSTAGSCLLSGPFLLSMPNQCEHKSSLVAGPPGRRGGNMPVLDAISTLFFSS